MANKYKTAKFWTIRLRNDEGWVSNIISQKMSFNTLKFTSYSAALAHCREHNYSQIDYVIALTEFKHREIEVCEIDYTATRLDLAK